MSRVDSPRRRTSLDGTWRFVADADLVHGPDALPMGVPIQVPGCWEAQLSEPFGLVHAWYWRDLELPADLPTNERLFVRFGAVMYRCDVFVDAQALASHEGGYTPFEVDLTAVRRDRPVRLAVRVTNPMNAITEYPALSDERLDHAERRVPELPIRELPHGKQTWYASQSGLWRTVALESRPNVSITRLRVDGDWATGRTRVRASVSGARPDGDMLDLSVLGPDGRRVAGSSGPATGEVDATIDVPDRLAWDIGDPNLYRLDASLVRAGTIIDRVGTRFGYRSIGTDAGRITLNGRPIHLRGALDQDVYAGTISTAPSRELLDRQMRLAREMGLNMLRCHIKVPDPDYLDAADEAGMLLWCELPSWLRMSDSAAERAEALLDGLVDVVGDHPSVVIWTVVNEDWGTDLRNSAGDRRWLAATARRLRELDPTRLVVDNSACPTADGPNFHLDTDLADFHRYAAMPDAALRWREQMSELAGRPDWLWSPHGDAVRTGDEPVVVSEFGTWGLPDPGQLDGAWWAQTGDGPARPGGIADRFKAQRLDRVWVDPAALAASTRALQLEALRYQVGEIRRHLEMAGMIVTEFTDAFWEANGLLAVDRTDKLDAAELAAFFGETALIVDVERRDLWGGERIDVTVSIASERAGTGGTLNWRLGTAGGSQTVGAWAGCVPRRLARLQVAAPDCLKTTDAELVVELVDDHGEALASSRLPCAIVPSSLRSTRADDEGLIVTTRLRESDVEAVERGGRLLLLADSTDALPEGLGLERPVRVQQRWPSADERAPDFTWTGDWIGAFSWILPALSAELPRRAPLDFAYQSVLPRHVLLGYDPTEHADEVWAGMFVGWIQAPAALLWTFSQGRGRLTVTTLRVADTASPVVCLLREAIIRLAAAS